MNWQEHQKEAERLVDRAGEWMDADVGWRAQLTREERLQYRANDLAEAQVHISLALVKVLEMLTPGGLEPVRLIARSTP